LVLFYNILLKSNLTRDFAADFVRAVCRVNDRMKPFWIRIDTEIL